MGRLKIVGDKDGKSGQTVGHATVDDDLLPVLDQATWHFVGPHKEIGRLVALPSGKRRTEFLHHVVWEHVNQKRVPARHSIRHDNGDKMDNRSSNLILVSGRVRAVKAPKRKDNTSGYKDVTFLSGKFVVRVGCDGKARYLGRYSTVLEAAYAVNLAYAELHPEVSPPNDLPADALTAEERTRVEANVARLLRPGRKPREP
jgi:hypothetical protein